MHICVLQIVTQINWFRPTLVNFFWSTSKFLFFREAWILSRSCGEDGEDGTVPVPRWQCRKTELQMDRNGTGFIFSPRTFRAFCLYCPAVGAPVGRRLLRRGACTACLRVEGTGRWVGVFGIPCIPATEHKCPVPDINQLFQEQREGFVGSLKHAACNVRLRNGRKGRG